MDQYAKELYGRVCGGAPLSKAELLRRKAAREPKPPVIKLQCTGANIGDLLAKACVK